MKKSLSIVTIALLIIITFAGCIIPPITPITVTLATPEDNSQLDTLKPNFSWNSSTPADVYNLQVATDSNFQNLVVDEGGLAQPFYATPSDVLEHGYTYYWRVNAVKGGQASNWSNAWTFQTTGAAKASITVNATLDGSPWSGTVYFSISGANSYSNNSVPTSFDDVSTGSYTITYSSGGPEGASLSNISPSSTQSVGTGNSITFTLNFNKHSAGVIQVNATIDGVPWSGNIDFTINGPMTDSFNNVPYSFTNMPAGNYTLTYNYGGPAGAVLYSITPTPTQFLQSSNSITYTLNFNAQSTSSVVVNATVDGAPWSGKVNFTLRGPFSDSNSSVPYQFNNLPVGSYTLTYNFGGPAGAVLSSITPQPSQYLSKGNTITFSMNFSSQNSSTINIDATLDGESWSGPANFTVSGPFTDSGTIVPSNSSAVPPGNYTFTYNYGGPDGAVLARISPAPYQSLPANATITFTMNFQKRQSTGTIAVNATLDGKPWEVNAGSGTVSYTLSGPKFDSSNRVPDTFPNMPSGRYSLSYNSGGPIGGRLVSITPGPTQNLETGGSLVFTMNFAAQSRGSITVNATLNGEPWSGPVIYLVNGPYVESGSNVPHMHSNAPAGMYTIEYRSGGPPEARLEGITPSSQQSLQAGGDITFTLDFRFIPGPTPENGLLK
jgi:hypothetical protein